MPTAVQPHTTLTRRSAIGFSLAALAAGLTVPALASAKATNSDADLIRLCDQFVAVETEECLLPLHDEYAPDFGPNHARYRHLLDEHERIGDALIECPSPTTQAGQAALARAALTWVPLDHDGNFAPEHFGVELIVLLSKGLAPDFAWPPRPGDCSTAHWMPPTSAAEIAAHSAAHDAWVASVEAEVQAKEAARSAEVLRRETPSLMTDDELRDRFNAVLRIRAGSDKIYAEMEDEILRRMLA